jgi:hypothetical protein
MTNGHSIRLALSLLVGAGSSLAGAACGGTVVFEEGAGEGGSTSASSTTGQGPSSQASATTGVSTSTGPMGCGSFLDQLEMPAGCETCLVGGCCDELVACDVGSSCWSCVEGSGDCTADGQAALTRYQECLDASCASACQSGCSDGDFVCGSGECIPATWQCDGFPDCSDGTDEDCGSGTGDGSGICGTGVTSSDVAIDLCLTDSCCDSFVRCASAEGTQACQECLEEAFIPPQNAMPLCMSAYDCIIDSGCYTPPDR